MFDHFVAQIPIIITVAKYLIHKMCFEGCKGQLISEQIFVVLNFPKMEWNIDSISALAYKMGQIL